MRTLFAALLALALTACGGGGSSEDKLMTITFSTSTLSFEQIEGGAPVVRTMTATATGDSTRDAYVGGVINGSGIESPIAVSIDGSRTATITVTSARGLAAGTYTGTITMMACVDSGCSAHHKGSPHVVSYTVTVRPALTASTQSVNLAAVAGQPSQTASFTFTQAVADAGVNIAPSEGWLAVAVSGNTVQVQANSQSLSPGNYSAAVSFLVPSSGQRLNVPVNLTVGDGLIVAAASEFQVTSKTAVEQMQGSIAVALAPGATAQNWRIFNNQLWLRFDMTGGPFGTDPVWRIDPEYFAQLPNNAEYTASITVIADGMPGDKTHTVRVRKALAEIVGIDGAALVAEQGGDLLVYGTNLASLPAGTAAVTVAGTTPTAVAALDDKVLRITLPAMSAGSYTVALNSASGMTAETGNTATMHVTPRNAYAYQAIDTQGLKSTILWDAVSKSVFVVDRTLNRVMRYVSYVPSGGAFVLYQTRSFPAIDGIGMAPDHSALVVMQGGTIHKLALDQIELSTIAQFNLGGAGQIDPLNVPLPIMGDNRLMHPLYGWVDLDTGSTTPLSFADGGYYAGQLANWGAVSGNGLRMIRPDSGRFTPNAPMYHMDVANPTFQAYNSNATPFFYRYAVSHDGATWAMNDQVVDFDLNIKGNVALPDGWVGNEYVLSRNGSRLYYYAQNAVTRLARVYVFDTGAALTSTTHFQVLGYIDLPDLPNCPYDSTGNTPDCYTFNTRMAIADDGQTLFVVGDRKFVVLPVPVGLQPAAAAQGSAVTGMVRLPGRL